jgi:hypothetical protein
MFENHTFGKKYQKLHQGALLQSMPKLGGNKTSF